MRDHKNGRREPSSAFLRPSRKNYASLSSGRVDLSLSWGGGGSTPPSVGGWWLRGGYLILYQSLTSMQIQEDREAIKLHPCSDSRTIKECLFVNYK